jgi:2',3'-cyclic-nucleotide 2'-phosphodiesterase/3'-nucleotidase
MKLFVALTISSPHAEVLADTSRQHFDTFDAVNVHDLHITLCYLGEAEPSDIIGRLATIGHGAFAVKTGRSGTFDDAAYVGIEDPDGTLFRLKHKIDLAIGESYEHARYPFNPHITLAYGDYRASAVPDIAPHTIRFNSFSLCAITDVGPNRFKLLHSFPFIESIKILSINDFHANFDHAAALVAAVNGFIQRNPGSIVLFGGDNYFGDPTSDLLEGTPVSDIIARCNGLYSSLGNHDYEYGPRLLSKWQKDGNFTFLCANIVNGHSFCMPWALFRHTSGRKIAFIGVTTQDDMPSPETVDAMLMHPLTDPVQAATDAIDEAITYNPDAIIALAHLGLKADANGALIGEEIHRLCTAEQRLDGVFGAHWHHFIKGSIAGIPIAEGGSNGRGFAILDLLFHPAASAVIVESDFVIIPDGAVEDSTTINAIQSAMEQTEEQLGQIIFTLEDDLPNKDAITNAIPLNGSPLSNLAVNVTKVALDSEVVLLYSGRLGIGLQKGSVTLRHFLKNTFFANRLYRVELKGSELRKNISHGLRTLEHDGSSPLSIAGVQVYVDPLLPVGKRLIDLRCSDGSTFDDEAYYSVIVDDFLHQNAMGFDFTAALSSKCEDLDLRSLLKRFFQHEGVVHSKTIEQLTKSCVMYIEG